MHKRSWLKDAKILPRQLLLSSPDIGVMSGEYIIPAGYGITDQNQNFIGIISVGFNIDKIHSKIGNYLASNTSYLIFNNHFEPIARYGTKYDEDFILHVKSTVNLDQDWGWLKKPLEYENEQYRLFKIFKPYNYVILIGENKLLIRNQLIHLLIPQLSKLALLCLIFIAILYFFRQKIVKPMVALSEQALLIAQGYPQIEVPELNSLEANNLRNALILVKQAFIKEQEVSLELNNTARKLEDTVQELKKSRSELVDSHTQLSKALSLKTDFLNNVSHEIRTPTQAITAISGSLVKNWYNMPESEKYGDAQLVNQAATRLFTFVNNLLDLSKGAAGKMNVELTNMNFGSLISETIAESKIFYPGSEAVSLHYVYSNELNPMIQVDPDRIRQVLRNLVSNAIRYGATEVVMSLIHDNLDGKPALHFTIKDDGVGIPADELKTIFQAFYQSSRTRTKAGGTGLGLSICQEIIEAHQGKIWAESNLDRGTTFHIMIPRQEESTFDMKRLTKITILVIDDEEYSHHAIRRLLNHEQYELHSAYSGSEGLEYLRQHADHINIVLLDLMMPDIYGINVLQEIKNDSKLKNIPVIIQTASHDLEERKRALELGSLGFIAKPYNEKNVTTSILRAIRVQVAG
jgi:two-component system sensor histidine kinase ChiS